MTAKRKRRTLTAKERAIVYQKTHGHCHVCGVSLKGKAKAWQADHVVPSHRGGTSEVDNFLPACVQCNRIRWYYSSKEIRKILRLGVLIKKEIEKGTPLGRDAKCLDLKRIRANHTRTVND